MNYAGNDGGLPLPIPMAHTEPVQGAHKMKNLQRAVVSIERIANDIDAFESLAAGMAAGLRAGLVDPDHLYTLVSRYAAAIRAQLDQLAATIQHVKE
jgi:hypothetical protein